MTLALEINGLAKSFGGLPATNDVSLAIEAGERRLIIGPNGAGKTTLFNLITGDLPADAGSIKLFDAEVVRLRTDERAQMGLARTFQIITLFPRDTLAHNVVLSLLARTPSRWNAFARRSGKPGAGMALNNIRQRLQARYGSAATLEVSAAHPGTLARITLPLQSTTA